MGKTTGFLEYERKEAAALPPKERIRNFREFHQPLPLSMQQKQGARCMECGVPFCQYGAAIAGMTSGCPLHNLIPEWNDYVYHGNFEKAYERLRKTSNFPEFTSRVCPALCEKACTLGQYSTPVSTKENERTIIEYAYEKGLAAAKPPKNRTGKKVAVVGSGPSGLAAADDLNRRGHLVTVFERADRIGGLLRYGIPNMKLEKWIIDRKVKILEEEGIRFETGCEIGRDRLSQDLLKEFDAIVFAGGASNPRNIDAPGRDAKNILFAVDYLTQSTKLLYDHGYLKPDYQGDWNKVSGGLAAGKDVVVIGGGDTGNDCVGTAIRQGAKSVLQLEMMPEPPETRRDSNPWPQWPLVKKTDYGQEEAIDRFGKDPRMYQTTVSSFKKDKQGRLSSIVLVKLESKTDAESGRRSFVPVAGSKQEVPCQLALIAAGFLGAEKALCDAFSLEQDARTNIKSDGHRAISTGKDSGKIFCAGDIRTGQSLVVKAIADGKACAKEVDEFLMGYSNL